MPISILNIDDKRAVIGKDTLYHFSIDRMFMSICTDVDKRNYFMSVLAEPLVTKEAIFYRQEVMKDLLFVPNLYEKLQTIFQNLSTLKEKYTRDYLDLRRAGRGGSSNGVSYVARNMLSLSAITLKSVLEQLKDVYDVLEKNHVNAEGLIKLRMFIQNIVLAEKYDEFIALCDRFVNIDKQDTLDYKIAIAPDGMIEMSRLTEHEFVKIQDPDEKNIFGFKKKMDPNIRCVRVQMATNNIYGKLQSVPMTEISEMLDGLLRYLFEHSENIAKELVFYFVAMRFHNVLKAKGAPMTFPTIIDERTFRFVKLYDSFLLVNAYDRSEVIPNTLREHNNRIAVFGENGSGKTTFLRSVGIMQLLAQAGMSVPVEIAELCVQQQISTQFAEAEKDLEVGNEAGKFEQEVWEIADVIDSLNEDSIIFLNESFQTTAYEEGAEGLYHILNYLTDRNITWILVSHLRQLEPRLNDDEACILHTHPNFIIAK